MRTIMVVLFLLISGSLARAETRFVPPDFKKIPHKFSYRYSIVVRACKGTEKKCAGPIVSPPNEKSKTGETVFYGEAYLLVEDTDWIVHKVMVKGVPFQGIFSVNRILGLVGNPADIPSETKANMAKDDGKNPFHLVMSLYSNSLAPERPSHLWRIDNSVRAASFSAFRGVSFLDKPVKTKAGKLQAEFKIDSMEMN